MSQHANKGHILELCETNKQTANAINSFQSRASADGLERQGHAHGSKVGGLWVEFGERVGRELPNKTVMPVSHW